MNSFIENVNYIAGLDNKYGSKVELYKNNLSLRNDEHSIDFELKYFDYNQKKIIENIKSYTGINISELETTLLNFKSHVQSTISSNVSVSFSYSNFVINNVATISVSIELLDAKIKLYELNISIKKDNIELYKIYGNVIDGLSILPTIAMLDSLFIDGIVNVSENIDNINVVKENILDVNTTASNIESVKNVSSNIDNVNNVSSNETNINTVSSNIGNVAVVKENINNVNNVSNNINNVNVVSSNIVDINAVSDIVSDINIISPFTNEIHTVSSNVTNVNIVGDNIANVNTVSPHVNEIAVVSSKIDNVKTVSLSIANVNNVGTNIESVNIVSSDIVNINKVANNESNINIVSSSINNVNEVSGYTTEIKRVSDDLNGIDTNGRSDIVIVADNLLKGINSEIVIASENIDNINKSGNNINEITIVSNNIDSIITDANSIGNINLIASDLSMAGLNNIVDAGSITDSVTSDNAGISMIETVSDNIANVNIVGTNINYVIAVSNNESNIDSVASTIIPVISEILQADTNASIATDKALEASASEAMAHKWSSEPEDVIVSGVLGVNDEYSAYHWAKKAEASAGGSITLDSLYDVNTSGILDGGILRYNSTTSTYVSYDFEHNDKLGLDLTANVTVSTGEIAWNSTEGTADLGLYGGSTLQIGQEEVRTIRNGTVSLITNGTLCMFSGTIGNSGRIKVKPFTAGFNEAMYLYGVATQDIISGSDGLITISGKVRDMDTTGASVGEVWHDEDIIYAKPNDNGRMTNIMPSDNELKLVVATVIHAHATNGTLEIRFNPFNENMYYTKVQNDILLNNKVPLNSDFILDLGGL